jgi:retron-type reverse transcriptase
VLEGGLVSPMDEGTPQGGPLSPLLSNLMLDVSRDNLDENSASIWVRRDGRAEGSLTLADVLARF